MRPAVAELSFEAPIAEERVLPEQVFMRAALGPCAVGRSSLTLWAGFDSLLRRSVLTPFGGAAPSPQAGLACHPCGPFAPLW